MAKAYKFFISHSSQTKELASHIYHQAVSNQISVWYDQCLLERGDNIKENLRLGIEDSDAFLLLHSKAAIESEWVRYEMEIAEQRSKKDKSFKLIVVKLDNEELAESWKPFLYATWNLHDQPGSILNVLSDIAGKKPIMALEGAALLSMGPSNVFKNESGTIAEHSRNYVLCYLAHIKKILTTLSQVGHVSEMQDSLEKILQLSLFSNLPILHNGVFLVEPGIYELIYANRMVKPPKITLRDLPERYSYSVLSNNEISCKLAILDSETQQIVRLPVPISLSIELDARL